MKSQLVDLPGVVLVLALAVGTLGSACDECGYGGAGCGDPNLRVCSGMAVPGQRVRAQPLYFDDTGNHAATFSAATSATPGVLGIEDAGLATQFVIVALDSGVGRIVVQVDGWKGKAYTFEYPIDQDGGPPFDAGPSPAIFRGGQLDGGDCQARALTRLPSP